MDKIFSRMYSNVLILAYLVALTFTSGVVASIMAIPDDAGLGGVLVKAALIPLGALLALGFLQIANNFARRAQPFDGWFAPINVNVIGMYVAAGMVFIAGFAAGIDLWFLPNSFSIPPELEDAINKTTALVGILNAVGGAALAGMATLAARNADSEDDDEVE